MKMWSVETETNSWNDDEFNGTYEECILYCQNHEYVINGTDCRLAEIEIDDRGLVVDTYRFVNEL